MTTFLIILVIFILLLWLGQSGIWKKKFQELNTKAQSEISALTNRIQQADLKISALSKYETILDAEAKAHEILIDAQRRASIVIDDAKNNAAVIITDAHTDIKTAKDEAKAIRGEARAIKELAVRQADALKAKAEVLLNEATVQSKDILEEARSLIKNAHKKAQEIAGDAYVAMQRANEWEKIAKAMQNIIDGYGDKYLKPPYSLLDDLAEEFSHTKAGEALRLARKKTQWMIESKEAAKCEYVEANRKETAVNFVLDAFNGKTDSALSKVKKDNYGTLEQMIKDAFLLVNNNGKAFRNAIITDEYLNARLDELKWAVITQELKWQEQEEQRRIKEQICEEEKARRDYEKALRDAAKEEETLKRLIEKAQRDSSQATEAQRAEFEQKLSLLEERLKTAEEKSQRALSMAQQTRAGNIYVISNIESFGEHVYKIGMTRRLEPLDRIRELGDASVPFEFDVHSMIYTENAPSLERELHKKFLRLQMNKVNARKEFFRVTLADIKAEVEKMGIDVRWTMTAEARQYKETLAIEEAMRDNTKLAQEWEESQKRIDPVSLEEMEDTEAA